MVPRLSASREDTHTRTKGDLWQERNYCQGGAGTGSVSTSGYVWTGSLMGKEEECGKQARDLSKGTEKARFEELWEEPLVCAPLIARVWLICLVSPVLNRAKVRTKVKIARPQALICAMGVPALPQGLVQSRSSPHFPPTAPGL